jgi:hypothetical protein
VVVRHHVAALAHDAAQPTPFRDPDAVLGKRAGHLLVRVASQFVGEVLNEVAAADDVQELRAAADREYREVVLERGLEQRQLGTIATLVRRVCLQVSIRAVRAWVDVATAGEDDPIERGERLLQSVLARGHEQRPSARALHRVDVIERDDRRGDVPRAPARLLRIRRDPNQRAFHAPEANASARLGASASARPRRTM